MASPSVPRWKRTFVRAVEFARPALRLQPPDPADELEALRALCHELIVDLPQMKRHVIGVILLHTRSREDIWHLRAQLFDAISQHLGERVARERIERLDMMLG